MKVEMALHGTLMARLRSRLQDEQKALRDRFLAAVMHRCCCTALPSG